MTDKRIKTFFPIKKKQEVSVKHSIKQGKQVTTC